MNHENKDYPDSTRFDDWDNLYDSGFDKKSAEKQKPLKLNKEEYGIIGELLVGEPKKQIKAIEDKVIEIEDSELFCCDDEKLKNKVAYQTPETRSKMQAEQQRIASNAESAVDFLEMAKNEEKEIEEYNKWSQEDLSRLIKMLKSLINVVNIIENRIATSVFIGKSSADLQRMARDKNFQG